MVQNIMKKVFGISIVIIVENIPIIHPLINMLLLPPVLVDSKGNFYGYFTANKYKVNRTEYELAQLIIDYWESIKEDVGEYYDKIFR
jgi:hypothetical protein